MVSVSDIIKGQKVSYKRKWIADRKKKHPEIDWEDILNVKRTVRKSKTD